MKLRLLFPAVLIDLPSSKVFRIGEWSIKRKIQVVSLAETIKQNSTSRAKASLLSLFDEEPLLKTSNSVLLLQVMKEPISFLDFRSAYVTQLYVLIPTGINYVPRVSQIPFKSIV